jgi:hypothetical protein
VTWQTPDMSTCVGLALHEVYICDCTWGGVEVVRSDVRLYGEVVAFMESGTFPSRRPDELSAQVLI